MAFNSTGWSGNELEYKLVPGTFSATNHTGEL